MFKIFKRIREIEEELANQDICYCKLQNRLSKSTKQINDLEKVVEEITKELEKVKKGIENGKSKN